jgi:ABC-2 type transport system permease protein
VSRRRVGAIIGHELRIVAQDPMPVMILIVFPLILMAFLKPTYRLALLANGHPGANGSEQVVPGQAVANGFYVVGMTSFAFFAEHAWNTWDRLRASCATSLEIVIGKATPRLLVSFLQFLAVFAIGAPLFGLHSQGPLLALVPLVMSFSACLVCLGVLITALARTIQQATALAFGGLVLFGAIGGALVPMDTSPSWARAIAPATPTYWVMRGFRSVILAGDGLAALALPIAVLLSMSAAFLAVSLARLRFADPKVTF